MSDLDFKPGDWVKGEFYGHPFEGEVWEHLTGWSVGNTLVLWANKSVPDSVTIL